MATLTPEEKEMAKEVAKYLNTVELFMVGLDVADGKIMEINVTSPCYFIREINSLLTKHPESSLRSNMAQFRDSQRVAQVRPTQPLLVCLPRKHQS